MDENLPVIRISVRNLVEFILREGDIDNRTGGGQDPENMQMGSRIHRKIQRQMGSDYQAEVPLKTEIVCDGFTLKIEGRADGLIHTKEQVMVDEIKGVLRELDRVQEPAGIHLAQAKCYASMVAEQEGVDEIGVQMTYCQMETEEVKRFQYSYQSNELKVWFDEVIRQYEKWAKFQIEWRKARNASIKGIEFPFPYRKGQRELAVSVYRTILRKKKLFIQAPTGVGKTISTVFPAVKAVGEELGEKIFYLTAKTITRTVAEQAFETLREQNLKFKVITLTAKEKICFCEETSCNPDDCPYAKGHFDRVNDAVYELLMQEDVMSREVLEAQARKHKVCPFEMALDVSTWVDGVICDYNYVFDPDARLRRFFAEGGAGGYLFLIDEAHNLVERGRQMYSAELCKEDFLAVKKLVKGEAPRFAKRLEACNKILLAMKKECENYKVLDNISHFGIQLMNVLSETDRYLEECVDKEVRETVLDFYFQVRSFLNIYDGLDENYVVYTEYQENGRFVLKLFCVNPAANLQKCLDKGNSAVFFSATLLPIQYYKRLLSTEKDNYAVYIDSSFDTKKRLLMNGVDVSTRYAMRSREMYQRYATYIFRVVKAKMGNYLIFFPSYRFMEDVYQEFTQLLASDEEEMELVIQQKHMDEEERENFLRAFEMGREKSLIGFGVLGGIFSEGIDLTNEKLIGTLIIGTGLPQVCNEREILKSYFDQKGLYGFDYAYRYPGMNKVLQAAGRVIRTEDDRGVILLLDERFQREKGKEIFPKEWADCERCRLDIVEEKIRLFWEKQTDN
ncbi:MAG: ATP-dependent DNA helicase [Coprococcus comes]|uniref:ATP-dependent DNA helicase n=1 Tax=Coprococcus comes TaxID=410072 RepID=UPI001D098EF5|nr:ATP-dependent DNA helicase [Coprococcus comes]MCB6468731.1 ATP-dependent DNA helicase [Coprococcus comes]